MSYENIDDDGRQVKLRKPRRCEWCGEPIAVGETAVVRVYRFDGQFQNARQHPECYEAMKVCIALNDVVADEGFDGGNMVRGKALHTDELAEEEAHQARAAASLPAVPPGPPDPPRPERRIDYA